MGDLGGTPGIEDRAQDIGYVGKSYNTMLLGEHCLGGVEVDLPVARERHGVDFEAGELPGNDVAVMLELRQQDTVAAVPGQRPCDKVDRLGRAAGEDQLIWLPADQVRGGGTRGLVARRHARRALVD